MKQKIKAGIIGASGYSGEQLVKLLLRHPGVELTSVTSRQYAGKSLHDVFPAIHTRPGLVFSEPDPARIAAECDAVFLALPHGVAAPFAVPLLRAGKRVFDLSADFRLKSAEVYRDFYAHEHPAPELLAESVYGLPEVYRKEIAGARLIACPGCYPTSILLPSIPLIRSGLVNLTGIIADSSSGVSGAGRKADVDYLFVECNESVRAYGLPRHRHLSEIEQELNRAAGFPTPPLVMNFTPHLVPTNRGILSTLYFDLSPKARQQLTESPETLSATVREVFAQAYTGEPFVRLLTGDRLPDTKNVTGTNFIEFAFRIDPRTGKLIVVSAEDNILKGASGQAVQCFNIVHGFEETAGLL
ncbi:MAG: N-acetyl-gamma-glutamyl-phosphate reductase [Verrucomicrobiae bacterium]|nr:N-acetyl-gamma-glutamyl-phosphate reductase [Verrucomicrobiae bacterium]